MAKTKEPDFGEGIGDFHISRQDPEISLLLFDESQSRFEVFSKHPISRRRINSLLRRTLGRVATNFVFCRYDEGSKCYKQFGTYHNICAAKRL